MSHMLIGELRTIYAAEGGYGGARGWLVCVSGAGRKVVTS